ncbi:PhlD [Streptomyces decoyicus]|uniref:PhlD n=1 Tax=Streptomyces decoyicus TaxID=249567 RepID=UPI002F9111B8
MPAHATPPVVIHPDNWTTTDEICDNITRHHPEHPRLGVALRVIRNTSVQRRAFAYPLDSDTVSGQTGIVDRNAKARDAARDLAAQATNQAISDAGLVPADITAFVSSCSTVWDVPHIGSHVQAECGLRPDVRRTELTTLGCIGGAQALSKALDIVTARPGSRVLVVVAEVISTIYHHADDTIEGMIYKALFGDSAAACIVTSEPLQPGLRIDDSWEYVLPGSRDSSYWGRLDEAGFHFDSTREAVNGPAQAMPALRDWLKQHDALAPDFGIIHAGGPAILNAVQKGLGLTAEQLAPSWGSLASVGNLGGASVLDVLRRTHDTPPADGDRGVMLAYGPGFATTALTGTWVS